MASSSDRLQKCRRKLAKSSKVQKKTGKSSKVQKETGKPDVHNVKEVPDNQE